MAPTCFLMTSVACMMQRGGSPWLRANRMACSRVTLRVELQQKRESEKKKHTTKVRVSLHTGLN